MVACTFAHEKSKRISKYESVAGRAISFQATGWMVPIAAKGKDPQRQIAYRALVAIMR
jgi:hypothetical protein